MEDVDHLGHRGRTLEVSFPVLLEEEYFSDIKKNDPNKKKQKKRSHSVDVEPPSSQHQQGCNRRNSISSIRNKSSLVPNEENSTISDDLLNFEEIVQEFSRTRFLDKPMKDALLRKREPAPESEHITEAFKKVSDNQTACPGKLTEADIPRLRQQWMESCQELLNGVPEELPPMQGVNHHIPLIDDNKRYNYHLPRCPDAFKPQLLEKIGLYTRAGWWESVQTDQAAPMLCIPKKDGKQLRTTIDCRKQNDNTRKDVTPFPDQDQICLEVARARYRSKIDFSQAFEQIHVVPEDVWKTAFATIYGTFVSHTMQIGDCNAPATFQRVMTMIFCELIGRCSHNYLDDMFVYSDSIDDHEVHLGAVFAKIKKHKIYLKAEKVELYAEKIDCLGHLIDDKGLHADADKMACIRDWRVPRNYHDIQRFLGLVQYLAHFLPDISAYTSPLSAMVKNGQPW